jgi:predicted SPOUT superfamily RNA methylase MTH1
LTIAKASASVKATILTPTDNLVKRFTLGFDIVVDCINSTTTQTPISERILCLVRKFLSAFELANTTLDRIEVTDLKI